MHTHVLTGSGPPDREEEKNWPERAKMDQQQVLATLHAPGLRAPGDSLPAVNPWQ